MPIKIKKGFTLIELLIVIVVIGILAAAIIPKLIGGTSKARDIKRVADIRNISSAIELYYADHGELPLLKSCDANKCGSCTVFGDVARFDGKLSSYLTTIPQDPQKNSFVKIHYVLHSLDFEKIIERFGKDLRGGKVQTPGQYLYQIFSYKGNNFGAAVLVSRVENLQNANYVLKKNRKSIGGKYLPTKNTAGGAWKIPGLRFDGLNSCFDKSTNKIEELKLCDKIIESTDASSIGNRSSETKNKCEVEKKQCKQEQTQCKQDCENEKNQCRQEKNTCNQKKKQCKDQCNWRDATCKIDCNKQWKCPVSCLLCSKTCPVCIRDCSIEGVFSDIGEALSIEKEPKNRCVYTPNDELYYIKVIK